MNLSESFKNFQDRLSAALVATARTAGQIAQEDVSFQRSLDSRVSEALDRHSSQLLSLANRLTLKAADGLDLSPSPSEDADDLETNWPEIVDVVDSLLERADTSLDEHTGRIKRSKPVQTQQVRSKVISGGNPQADKDEKVVQRSRPKPPGGFSRSSEIKKPQLEFPKPPVYDEQRPFKPLLRRKPHAIVPLEDSIVPFQSSEYILQ
jgi:exosome complex exonuclease RRP6